MVGFGHGQLLVRKRSLLRCPVNQGRISEGGRLSSLEFATPVFDFAKTNIPEFSEVKKKLNNSQLFLCNKASQRLKLELDHKKRELNLLNQELIINRNMEDILTVEY